MQHIFISYLAAVETDGRCRQINRGPRDIGDLGIAAAGIEQEDDFLRETGDYEEVTARALKRVLAEQLTDSMAAKSIKKSQMAEIMHTSRSQVDRVLDPANLSIQLDTLVRAAAAVGKVVDIRIKKVPKVRA